VPARSISRVVVAVVAVVAVVVVAVVAFAGGVAESVAVAVVADVAVAVVVVAVVVVVVADVAVVVVAFAACAVVAAAKTAVAAQDSNSLKTEPGPAQEPKWVVASAVVVEVVAVAEPGSRDASLPPKWKLNYSFTNEWGKTDYTCMRHYYFIFFAHLSI
jgi:hypothetical protein